MNKKIATAAISAFMLISLISIMAAAPVAATTPTVTITIADTINLANVATVPVTITSDEDGTYTYVISDGATEITDTGAITAGVPVDLSLDLSTLADGPITADASVVDADGNVGDALQDTATKDVVAPTIENALAIPDMISLMTGTSGNMSTGPNYTNLIVEAYDVNDVYSVTLNFRPMLEKMFANVKFEDNARWQSLLTECESVPMGYLEGNVWSCDLNVWDIIWVLRDQGLVNDDEISLILSQKIQLGNFTIPVTVTDLVGNENYATIELAIVDIQVPLEEGWNLRSTPVALANPRWGDIVSLGQGDSLSYDVALRLNVETQEWEIVDEDYEPRPLEAIYIHATKRDQIGLAFSRQLTMPTMRQLGEGWNLMGFAPNSYCWWLVGGSQFDWEQMYVYEALVPIEQTPEGLRGYTAVVGPAEYFEYHEEYQYGEHGLGDYQWGFGRGAWVYTARPWEYREDYVMEPFGGYLVFMENPDLLAGFSFTPVQWMPMPTGLQKVPFEWYEVTPTNADDSDATDDDSFTYELPWSFPFAGKQIVTIEVSSNGHIELLEGGEEYSAGSDYDEIEYFWEEYSGCDFIFAWMDDLDSEESNGYYAVRYVEDMNAVVIQWTTETCQDGGSGRLNSFQLWLFPDGSIQWNFNYFNYEDYSYDLYSGIQDGTSQTKLDVGYEISIPETSYRFFGEYTPEFGEPY